MGFAGHDFQDEADEVVSDTSVTEPAPVPATGATSIIRAAKLVCGKGEFVCVVRDVSAGGITVRCFHTVPEDPAMALELQNGETFEIERTGGSETEARYRFCDETVDCNHLVREIWHYPRRPLRLNLAIPLTLRSLSGKVQAVTLNVSQQGCCVESDCALAIAQKVMIESEHLPPIRSTVRWRRDGECGLVFDDTFSLKEFAFLVARLQCPVLLDGASTGQEF